MVKVRVKGILFCVENSLVSQSFHKNFKMVLEKLKKKNFSEIWNKYCKSEPYTPPPPKNHYGKCGLVCWFGTDNNGESKTFVSLVRSNLEDVGKV